MEFLFQIKEALVSNYIFFAPFFGILPALIWLWFWLKEDIHPEPNKFIILTFLMGMLAVVVTLPIQTFTKNIFQYNTIILFTVWASIEEILKFLAGFIGGIHNKVDDEPIDPVIYMIVSALGFVALENTFFLIDPLNKGNFVELLITGNMRFIGATLLHILSSGTVGVFLALSFYKSKLWKRLYGLFGIIIAIILHTSFNLFIINWISNNFFLIFALVWLAIIILLLMFEKIKNTSLNIKK